MSLYIYSPREIRKLETETDIFWSFLLPLPLRKISVYIYPCWNFRTSRFRRNFEVYRSEQWIIEMGRGRSGIQEHPEFFKTGHFSPILTLLRRLFRRYLCRVRPYYCGFRLVCFIWVLRFELPPITTIPPPFCHHKMALSEDECPLTFISGYSWGYSCFFEVIQRAKSL